MNERTFLKNFVQSIKRSHPNAFVYKIPDTGALGGKRPFDLIIIFNGATLCVEAKIDGGKPTLYQQFMLDLVGGNGAFTYIITPSNTKDLLNKLSELENWRK